MATWPVNAPVGKPPLVYVQGPSDVVADLWAEPFTPVLSPVNGHLVYVGDGVTPPFENNGPGVVAILDDDNRYLHILGYLDRGLLSGWRAIRWNSYFGENKARSWHSDGLIRYLSAPGKQPQPSVSEGAIIGRTADNRPGLRWSMVAVDGTPINPMVWVANNALRPPVWLPRSTPPPAPIVPIKPDDTDNTWLVVAAVVGGALVLIRRRRRRKARR